MKDKKALGVWDVTFRLIIFTIVFQNGFVWQEYVYI